MPFRNILITLNTMIDYYIFGTSSNSDVVVGKDNWLFYTPTENGDPVACYQGLNLLTEDELAALAANCVAQRDFLAESGVEFVIFIAPNKERIYSEYMPDRYGDPSDVYQTLQIVEYLRDNTDLRVVYPYEELMAAKENLDENIYYVTDSHWNAIGSYVGTAALLSELGIDMPAIDSDQITITDEGDYLGDLSDMIHLTDKLSSNDTTYVVSGYDTHDFIEDVMDFNNVYSLLAEDADTRKLYVLRDSFAYAMADYIGSQFNETWMRYWVSYSYDDYLEQEPDIFVYETVERLADKLMDFSVVDGYTNSGD
jgi:hypothetical protein